MGTTIHRAVAEGMISYAEQLKQQPVLINLKGMPGYWKWNLQMRFRDEKYTPDAIREKEIIAEWNTDQEEWRKMYFELHGEYPEEFDEENPTERI